MALNKVIPTIIFLPALLFIGALYLTAEEILDSNEISREISNNISMEYVTCAAYSFCASEAFKRSGDLETAAKYEEYRNSAVGYALIAAKDGRTQEMAEKVTMARLDLKMKSMMSEIDKDIANISILMNKYSGHCKEIMEDPDRMMSEWTDKMLKKHNLK